jgi:hypothetical protein
MGAGRDDPGGAIGLNLTRYARHRPPPGRALPGPGPNRVYGVGAPGQKGVSMPGVVAGAAWPTHAVGEAAARAARSRRPRPTAHLALSDNLAIGAVQAANWMGLGVPGDVSGGRAGRRSGCRPRSPRAPPPDRSQTALVTVPFTSGIAVFQPRIASMIASAPASDPARSEQFSDRTPVVVVERLQDVRGVCRELCHGPPPPRRCAATPCQPRAVPRNS